MGRPESLQAFLEQSKFVLGDIQHAPAQSPRVTATQEVKPSSLHGEVNGRRVATGIVGSENTPPYPQSRNQSATELPADAIAFTLRSSSYAAPTSSTQSPQREQVAMTSENTPTTKASSNLRLRLQQLRSKVPSLRGGQSADDLVASIAEKECPPKPAEPMKAGVIGPPPDLEEITRMMEEEMLIAEQLIAQSRAHEQHDHAQDVTETVQRVVEEEEEAFISGTIERNLHATSVHVNTTPVKKPKDSDVLKVLNERVGQFEAYIQIAADLMRAIMEELGPDTAIKSQHYLRLTVDELKSELEHALNRQKKAKEDREKATWKVDAEQIAAQMKEELRKAKEEAEKEQLARNNMSVDKSLEHQTQFANWPKTRARPQGSSQIRRVKLQNLSIHGNAGQVLSLVWGGRVEKLQYNDGDTSAWVQFLKAEDCKKYWDATPNGIVVPGDSRIVMVEMDTMPMSTNEWVKSQIENGVTRCIRAIGVDEDVGMGALTNIATQRKRRVERIVNGTSQTGHRVVEFRFLSIEDAFNFKMELQKDEDWEHCNILFARDPCEMHNGVHMLP